jgi:DNA-binding NtrC family response regulator
VASVLVSEVERNVRRLLTTIVERHGHEAIVLEPGPAVPPRADVLLVDPITPLAAEHIRLARASFPGLPLICTNPLPPSLAAIGGALYFLPKPFTPDGLVELLAAVVSPV